MRKYGPDDPVQDQAGDAVNGATVTVYLAGTTTAATLYSDDGVTTTGNPVTTDAYGRYEFHVEDGWYKLVFSGGTPAITTTTYDNVEIFDERTRPAYAAHMFQGADAGAKIAAAIAALPATGGTVDARGLEGAQTISANIFAGVTKPGTLIFGDATFTVSVTQTIPSNITLLGAGMGRTIFLTAASSATSFYPFKNATTTGAGNQNIVIRYCTFDGNKANQTNRGQGLIHFDNVQSSEISYNEFKNITGIGAGVVWSTFGDNSKNTDNLLAFNNLHDNGLQGVVSTLSRTANVVTATTSAAHQFIVGDTIYIVRTGNATFDGNFTVATVPTSTTFTYSQTAANASTTGGSAYNVTTNADAFAVGGQRIRIIGNRAKDNTDSAVGLQGQTSGPMTISGNDFENNALGGVNMGADGSPQGDNSQISITGNILKGNGTNVLINRANDVSVTGNTAITGATGSAAADNILIKASLRVSISGNPNISGAELSGIHVDDNNEATAVSSEIEITGNGIRANGRHGIFVNQTNAGAIVRAVTIVGNSVKNNSTATSNTYDGINLNGTKLTNVAVVGNDSSDDQGSPTQRYGLVVGNATKIAVGFNVFDGNATGAATGLTSTTRSGMNYTGAASSATSTNADSIVVGDGVNMPNSSIRELNLWGRDGLGNFRNLRLYADGTNSWFTTAIAAFGVAPTVGFKADGNSGAMSVISGGVSQDVILTPSGPSGSVTVNRLKASQGTPLVAGDLALSAGWGDTPAASISAVVGTDQATTFTVSAGTANFGANPTVILTFKDLTWTNNPICTATRGDATAPTTGFPTVTTTATTMTLTFQGTPGAGTYTFNVVCMGR